MTEAAALNEPWATAERQQVATHFGTWAFLATETLFFGAIFLFYTVSRTSHGAGFTAGGAEANVAFGTANTLVLLTSSLTMAIAERAVKEALVPLARAMLWVTIALGLTFLTVKGFEYAEDVREHLVPGPGFKLAETGAAQFWSFYWVVTVVHACHLTIGLGLLGRLLLIPRARLACRWTTAEGTALYWHLVDVVWVFLYPLLPGRPVTPEQRRRLVTNPLLTWGALMLLVLATLGYAYLPHGPLKAETGLAIALAKAGLIAWVFMQLRSAAGIVRLAALAGVTWATFLYLFSFADFLTR